MPVYSMRDARNGFSKSVPARLIQRTRNQAARIVFLLFLCAAYTHAQSTPTITSVTPTTGGAGTVIEVFGSNFGSSQGSSTVTINGTSLGTASYWTQGQAQFTLSTGLSSGNLVVTVGGTASNAISFTITTTPTITSVTPTTGGAGTVIEVFGSNFGSSQGSSTVTINGTSLGTASYWTQGQAQFTLSTGLSSGNLVVTVGGVASNSVSFTVYANPTISSLSSTTGGVGQWVQIQGSNFGASQGSSAVTFNGTAATALQWTSGYINVDVPSGATTGNVVVTVAGTASNGVTFTVITTPYIASINPPSGGVGTSVGIYGSNFGSSQGNSTVTFNGVAASASGWGNNQINANVPTGATTGNLVVTVGGTASNAVLFTLPTQAPTFTSSNATTFPLGTADSFSVTATGSPTPTLSESGALPSGVSFTPSTGSLAGTPTTSGTYSITFTASNGVSPNATQSFTLTVPGPPTISGLSRTSGTYGTAVTITGTNFGTSQGNSIVAFDGVPATTITQWSATSITALVPFGASTGNVSVTVSGPTATSSSIFSVIYIATVTDSLGNVSTYSSGQIGGVWTVTSGQGSGCSTCTVRGQNQYTYDAYGNVATFTDPAGHVTTYTYDSSSNMLSQSTPLNGTTNATTTYTYNNFGEVLTVTDPLGNVTTNTYDSHENLLTVTSPKPNSNTAASVTQFGYNSLGELTTITDPLNHVTTMTYTAAGLIATITDAQNNVTTYGYDAKGNRTSVIDALNHTTTFTYDAMSRLTQITYPDSTTASFTYDVRGRRTSATDQNGKTTSYAYDDADRLTSVTDAANHTTNYGYDTEDNLTSITDANTNQTQFTYDAFGRVTKTTFPSSLAETYQYDADNNLTQKTDRKGQTIQYLYDALNRLTQKTYPDTTNVEYTYDLVGKILQVNDPTGTYAFAYDNMGRLIGTTTSYSFLTSRSFTNAYAYDAASNRTGFTDPEGGSTAYSYDTLNRLTSLAPPSAFGSGSFGFSYDALSRRTQMTRPNSVATNYAYDNLSRLTSVLHNLSGSTIDGAAYSLDNTGNRTSKTDQLAGITSNYTYDAIYQLAQVTQANNTTESYSYDAVGNRTASLGVSSYTTNASNELTATSNATYTYDSNGNTLTKTVGSNTTSYAWDFENRLTSVTLPGSGGTVTFEYDPLGRRIYKSSSSGTSIYAYDGDNLIEEANISGAVVARYTETQAIDEPLAELRSSTTSYYEADGLGSISSLTNAAGAVANTYTYDSFGKQTASSGSLTNPFQYTAREFDVESGLYYVRARYLDSSTGRFLGEDPVKFYAGVNFYTYALNSPTYWIDPSGFNVTVKLFPGNQPAGHIGLGVNTNDTVGFYPNYDTLVSPGHVQRDDQWAEGPAKDCIIIITTPQQDTEIQHYIDLRKKKPGLWRPGRDCSNFVHDALGAGEVKVDDSTFPHSLFDNLKKLPHTSCSNVIPLL